ncbi:MAG: ATP-dependent helicase, partial [Desulfobacterales bacterium]
MQVEQQISHSRRTFKITYSKDLNRSQLNAVTFKEGPLLVIAGAGSGKTRTLTYRVARLVEEGVSPQEILLLTFTRKSAQEMLRRAADLLDNRCESVSGGTFHSFANAKLRKYATKIGFKSDFTILDRVDMENLIAMLRKNTDALPEHRLFPKKQTLAQIISKSVNKGLPIDEIIYNEYPHFYPNSEPIKKIYEEYTRQKRENHFLDYDDLLVYLKQLLQDQPEIRRKISSAYQFIMVDEYQDTNTLQAEILYLLSNINKNIMVVGDDSQSIYAFRGASFKNIMQFPRIFPNTKIIRLEKNYRSFQPILDLANVIIDQAAHKYKKNLFTTRRGGNRPLLLSAESEHSQSRFIIEKIRDLSKNGIPLGQVAVLFRASFHSFDLEIELTKEQIPFIKVGGFKFMESAHIKDVLAHLRVISNPYDWLSWYRIFLLL